MGVVVPGLVIVLQRLRESSRALEKAIRRVSAVELERVATLSTISQAAVFGGHLGRAAGQSYFGAGAIAVDAHHHHPPARATMALTDALVLPECTLLPFDRMGSAAFGALVVVLVAAFVTAVLTDALYATPIRRVVQARAMRRWLTMNFCRHPRHEAPAPEANWPRASESPRVGDSSRAADPLLTGSPESLAARAMRAITELASVGKSRTLFALRDRQLCGQVATALQAQSSLTANDQVALAMGFAPTLSHTWIRQVIERGAPDWHVKPHPAEEDEMVPSPPYPGLTSDDFAARSSEARQLLLFHQERGVDDLQAYLASWWQRIDYCTALLLGWGFIGLLSQLSDPEAGFRTYSFVSPAGRGLIVLTIVTMLLVPLMRRLVGKIAIALG